MRAGEAVDRPLRSLWITYWKNRPCALDVKLSTAYLKAVDSSRLRW